MMLHDGSNIDFSMMGGFNGSSGGMLPSMPEGDDEDDSTGDATQNGDEGEQGMDVDGGKEERGRTRGVRTRSGANGNGFHHPPMGLKEEMPDDSLGGFGGLAMVGMQA